MSFLPRKHEVASQVALLDRVTDEGRPFWETPEELSKALLKDAFGHVQARSLVFVNWRVAGGSIQVGPFATQADALRWHARVGGEGTVHTLSGPGLFSDPLKTSELCACGHIEGLHEHPKAAGRCMAGHKTVNGPGCECRTFTRKEAA